MPIPVNHYHYNTTTINHVYSKLIDIILFSRLQKQEKTNCLNNEIHGQCIDKSLNQDIDSSSIVINILQKESDDLLERWIMSFDIAEEANSNDKNQFIKNINDFIYQMPANEFKSLYTISSFDNSSNQQCYSHISNQDIIEFRQDAQLKAQRFHLPSLSLEVVYDEKPKKKPTISLQSLSSPSFIPWSKMQQSQSSLQQEIHPLANIPATTVSPAIVVNNTPVIAVRRLSRLSLSAIDDEDDDQIDDVSTSSPFAIPIPSPRMQYTHHSGHHTGLRTTFAYSTSPNNLLSPTSPSTYSDHPLERRNSLTDQQQHHGCFVGSFEESLFSGRMSSMPSKPITFHSQIGVLGYGDCKASLKCPPHWSILFPATFYKLPQDDIITPYVGTVDIGEYATSQFEKKKSQPGYRIPPKGQLQVVVKNPNKTAVKLFLIPYDVTDMPKNTKTFLRQKSYVVDQDDDKKQLLRYAIHVQICRTEKKRIYLYKTMRIVFANRKADAREKFNVVCEGPKEPVYIPM
jgi:hypothetical protein